MSVSSQAAKNGSHTPLCRLPMPHCAGNSGKLTALKPRSALRRISSGASCGSASHGSCNGMIRSGWLPAHTSRCQSFQARSVASPSSRSSLFQNTVPAKPAISEGKFSEAQMPARSMSAIRASISQQPRRISSNRAASMLHSSCGRPITALSPIFGYSRPS
ncbi:Uncharacterised protein [Mycobacterium tuberculosis]|nr:Uncharacterised protein [Mycobacterium tuberculosis]